MGSPSYMPAETPLIGALVHKTVNQSIPNNTNTVLTWDGEYFDTDDWHDNATNNSRLTVPAGVNYVQMHCGFQFASSTPNWTAFYFRKNGASLWLTARPDGKPYFEFVSPVFDVSADDYLDVSLWHQVGVATNLLAGTTGTRTAWLGITGFK